MAKDRQGEFWRPLESLSIERSYKRACTHSPGETVADSDEDRGIRLWSSASAAVHGIKNATYALQFRAPLKLGSGSDSEQQMIATAQLSREALVDLRDALTEAIKTIDKDSKRS